MCQSAQPRHSMMLRRRSSRLQSFIATFKDGASRSTIHGLQYVFQSNSLARQIFWIILLLAGFGAGLFHTMETYQKYSENPVLPVLKLMSLRAEFPSVTICGRKPASDQLSLLRTTLVEYLRRNWGLFRGWYPEERKQLPGEKDQSYLERQRVLLRHFLHIMWVSADLRDISHLDQTMILSCKYNQEVCNQKQFKLLQTFRYWNCYTFSVEHMNLNRTVRVSNRGDKLELVLFTDSYEPMHFEEEEGKVPPFNAGSDDAATYLFHQSCLNMLYRPNAYESAGLRVFLHEKREYPLFSKDYLDVQSGMSSVITLRPIQNTLFPDSNSPCTPPLKTVKVKYVKFFRGSSNTGEYDMNLNDFVIQAKQKMMQDKCGCYSHVFPINVRSTELCYFVPQEQWLSPSEDVLRRIRCHDLEQGRALGLTMQLQGEFAHQRPCDYVRYRPTLQSTGWPRFEDTADIWEDLIYPQIRNGVGFLPRDAILTHHIFNYTALGSGIPRASREELLFVSFITTGDRCRQFLCDTADPSPDKCNFTRLRELFRRWSYGLHLCLHKGKLAKNMVRMRINMHSPKADVYMEKRSYEWTEALAETGGAFGLWLGVSLLIVFELLEFGCLLVLSCFKRRTEESEVLHTHVLQLPTN